MTEPVISEVETVLDNGKFGTRTIKFETGVLARQAAGSVSAYLDGDTMLLSATTAGKHPKDHFDFFPLTIDVEERMYAAGRIPPARSSAPRAARARTRSSLPPHRPSAAPDLQEGPAQRGPGRHHP